MCGIVGLFNPFGLPNQFRDRNRLTSALLALNHRGPDAKGILISKIAWLGHVRLSIIDLEKGDQPMNNDGVR